jgi:hypothetical protein
MTEKKHHHHVFSLWVKNVWVNRDFPIME